MSFLVALWRPLAYLSLPFILFRSISDSSPVGRYYARAVLYVSAMFSVATCSTAIAAVMRLIGRPYDTSYIVARTFYEVSKRLMGIHVEIDGEEYLSTKTAVYMMNHQSMLDILIVGRLMPKQATIMSKKSLQYTPLGPFMTLSGAIFVDRSNSAKAVESLKEAGKLMRKLGTSLWIFPEGTRHSQEVPDMLPLKKGGFHLAIQAGIPIVPVVAENYWKIYRQGVFDEGRIKVRVLPPVSTTGLTAADVSNLATQVRSQMVETLRDISDQVPTERAGKEKVEAISKLESRVTPQAPIRISDIQSPSEHIPIPEAVLTGVLSASESSSSLNTWQSGASETGTETEEDEGMILVGRPA